MKIPLVLILGRPNVGKSTLFNRLTKSRDSIVDDQSGITRDRVYGEVDWNGKVFRLMDTGGYVPDSKDLFETAIREQVHIAIDEADAILFVTDGRAGITALDEEIVKILRTSKKPNFLLVNKADNPKHSVYKNEFYRFGLKKIYDVSALNGRNLGDLLDEILTNLEFTPSDPSYTKLLKIAMLGKPNVGKSSLTNSLLGYDRSIVTEIPGTTRDSINSILKYYGEEIVLVDTAGLRKKAKVKENVEFYSYVRTLRALGECDVAIILVDAASGVEKQDQKIVEEAVQRRKGIVIAVNKWDLIEKDQDSAKKYEAEIRNQLGTYSFIPVIFISALTKQRIFKLIDIAKKVQTSRLTKIPTKELNDKLLPELKKTPPPASPTGREVHIKFLNQVGDYYPVFLVFASNSKFLQDNYRRFIERLIRTHFDFEGVPMTVTFRDS